MTVNWNVAFDWVPTVANIIACIAVGVMLWRAYGRVQSGAKKAWITVGAVALGFFLYGLVQAILEGMFPATRINGDIVVYNVTLFAPVLAVVIAAIFVLRKAVAPGVSRA